MEQYFSINSRNRAKFLSSLLLFSAFMVSCNNRDAMKENLASNNYDSIFYHHALTNHIKHSRQVKDVYLKGVNKSNLLIYRYCDETCDKCIEEDLQALLKFQEEIGKEFILVVPSFPESRNTKIRLRNELKDFNYINIEKKEDMPIDENTGLAMRFFIFYPKDKESGYIFFPTKGIQGLTQTFFKVISEEILKSKQ